MSESVSENSKMAWHRPFSRKLQSLSSQSPLGACSEFAAQVPARILRHSSRSLYLYGMLAIAFSLSFANRARSSEITNLNPEIEIIRAEFHLPALALAVIVDGKLVGAGATGTRQDGTNVPVTLTDIFQIGSCTKSMTAALAGMLVEEGKIRWSTTVAEVFPEWRERMVAALRTVTLEQLLSHRSGISGKADEELWTKAWLRLKGEPRQQRLDYLAEVVTKPLEAEPGTKYIYSNTGYALAGAMLEKITDQPWEILITEKLFKPLQLDSAGFGPPNSVGKIDQPIGHIKEDGRLVPTPDKDNPPAIAPGAAVHCSILDLAKYAQFQLEGSRGSGQLLKPETFEKIHTPASGQDYALGWIVSSRSWARGRTLSHTGSNTMFFTAVWVAPNRNFAVVASTNLGGEEAAKGVDHAVAAMIRKYLPE